MNSNITVKEQIAYNALARILAREMHIINNNFRFSNKHLNFPINVYFYDLNKVSPAIQQQIIKKTPMANFCRFNPKQRAYEIFLRNELPAMLERVFNKRGIFDFWGEKVNISGSNFNFSKIFLANILRHEIAHIKISSLVDFSAGKIDFKKVPRVVINILEDVRVNSFYDKDKGLKIVLPQLYKPIEKAFSSNAHPTEVLLAVCGSFNNPNYLMRYNSDHYYVAVEAFERAKQANNIQEIIEIAKDYVEKTNVDNVYNNEQNISNKNSQDNSQESMGGNDFDDNQDWEDNFDNDWENDLENNHNNFNESTNLFDDMLDDINKYNNDSDSEQEINENELVDLVDMQQQDNNIDEILDELRNESYKITQDGMLINKSEKNTEKKNPLKGEALREYNNNSLEELKKQDFIVFNKTDGVVRGDITLNKHLIQVATNEAKNILKKAFVSSKYLPTNKPRIRLNTRKLADCVVNPDKHKMFLKKTTDNDKKQPIPITFFLDLSQSMEGAPVETAKHIIAVLKNLQNERYIDANIILHAEKHNIEKWQYFNLGQVSNSLFLEKLSQLEADGGAECLKNAILIANQTLYNTLKNSRFICFFTDAWINDDPAEVQEALKKISGTNKKIFGLYADEDSSKLEQEYFSNFIRAKENELDNKEKAMAKRVISLVKAISVMANPDLTASQAVKILEKDKHLLVECKNDTKPHKTEDFTFNEKNSVTKGLKL